ncbi:hypothetical protein BT63DRAFT_17228 [Microthyrium microscopicum]|uniref:Uncharacterized protein n=1 Tax=Microthyrium microscopicum TaxID=703497 RepID=A0A6A6UT74_9PEZI|nr:hypothetical protein BT63DRAFT_17228 [Microthyrium microscopicum]
MFMSWGSISSGQLAAPTMSRSKKPSASPLRIRKTRENLNAPNQVGPSKSRKTFTKKENESSHSIFSIPPLYSAPLPPLYTPSENSSSVTITKAKSTMDGFAVGFMTAASRDAAEKRARYKPAAEPAARPQSEPAVQRSMSDGQQKDESLRRRVVTQVKAKLRKPSKKDHIDKTSESLLPEPQSPAPVQESQSDVPVHERQPEAPVQLHSVASDWATIASTTDSRGAVEDSIVASSQYSMDESVGSSILDLRHVSYDSMTAAPDIANVLQNRKPRTSVAISDEAFPSHSDSSHNSMHPSAFSSDALSGQAQTTAHTSIFDSPSRRMGGYESQAHPSASYEPPTLTLSASLSVSADMESLESSHENRNA